jgi:hypothetical protein
MIVIKCISDNAFKCIFNKLIININSKGAILPLNRHMKLGALQETSSELFLLNSGSKIENM